MRKGTWRYGVILAAAAVALAAGPAAASAVTAPAATRLDHGFLLGLGAAVAWVAAAIQRRL